MTFSALGSIEGGTLFMNFNMICLILTRMLSHIFLRGINLSMTTYLFATCKSSVTVTYFISILHFPLSLLNLQLLCCMQNGRWELMSHFDISPVVSLGAVPSLFSADALYKGNLTVTQSVLHPLYRSRGGDMRHFGNRKQGLTVTGLLFPLGHLIGC